MCGTSLASFPFHHADVSSGSSWPHSESKTYSAFNYVFFPLSPDTDVTLCNHDDCTDRLLNFELMVTNKIRCRGKRGSLIVESVGVSITIRRSFTIKSHDMLTFFWSAEKYIFLHFHADVLINLMHWILVSSLTVLSHTHMFRLKSLWPKDCI